MEKVAIWNKRDRIGQKQTKLDRRGKKTVIQNRWKNNKELLVLKSEMVMILFVQYWPLSVLDYFG